MKEIFYHSSIINVEGKSSLLKSSYILHKNFHCRTDENVDTMIDKLERLKKENFNRIYIPDFEYTVNDKIVTIKTPFIKGFNVATLIPQFANIIHEDIVQRDSDWTFNDFAPSNFIIDEDTEKIFAVDLQSYDYTPNKLKRESAWEMSKKINLKIFKNATLGKWIRRT